MLYGILRHDTTRPGYGGYSRTNYLCPKHLNPVQMWLPQTIETLRFFGRPKFGKKMEDGEAGRMNPDAIKAWESVNTAKAIAYMKRWASGFINASIFPNGILQASWGGSVVEIFDKDGKYYYVTTVHNGSDGAKVLAASNPDTHPWLWQKMVAIDRAGKIWETPCGPAYTPILRRYLDTQLGIPVSDVELFPTIPATGLRLTVKVDALNIRDAPAGANVVGVLKNGDPFTVFECKPCGQGVWGRVDAYGWVALMHPTIPNWFTSAGWSLTTLPCSG